MFASSAIEPTDSTTLCSAWPRTSFSDRTMLWVPEEASDPAARARATSDCRRELSAMLFIERASTPISSWARSSTVTSMSPTAS